LEKKLDQAKLTKKALNEIRTKMVNDFMKRPKDFEWIDWINWSPEGHNALGIGPAQGLNKAGRAMRRK